MLTYGQKLEQQGFDRGDKHGFERGDKQGFERGERSLLLRMLQRRFGELPAAVTRQIDKASTADLEVWSDRILDADSLDEVFSS